MCGVVFGGSGATGGGLGGVHSHVNGQDVALLEQMFAEQSSAATKGKGKGKGGAGGKAGSGSAASKAKLVQILDRKRANAIAIGLSQFKSLKRDAKTSAQAVLEAPAWQFTVGSLETLRDILPTTHEIKRLNGYR